QAAARLLSAPGTAALLFGDEVRGLSNRDLRRAGAVATIPTAGKSSLNLAQAVLVFGYEILKARNPAPPPARPEQPLADERLPARLWSRRPSSSGARRRARARPPSSCSLPCCRS